MLPAPYTIELCCNARGRAAALWGASPVSARAKLRFGVSCGPHFEPFSTSDRDVIGPARRDIKWLHRLVMLAYGPLSAAHALLGAGPQGAAELVVGALGNEDRHGNRSRRSDGP